MPADLTNDNIVLSITSNSVAQAPSPYVNGVTALQSIAQISQQSPEVKAFLSAALSDNTRRAYLADLADFLRWGGCIPCSSESLAQYIANRAAKLSHFTITRRVVAIGRAHTSQGLQNPASTDLVRTILRGVRRLNGKRQRQAAPLLKMDLLALLPYMKGVKGTRDRALIMLGFAAALRRSELVALEYADLRFVREGLILYICRSKTDQHAAGRKIGIPTGRTEACAVKAVQNWLESASINSGPVFRSVSKSGVVGAQLSAQSVSLIIKAYAKAAGLLASDFSGHSLRAGLVTSASQAGVAPHKIMAQTGHHSVETLNRYIRDANLFEQNAAGSLL